MSAGASMVNWTWMLKPLVLARTWTNLAIWEGAALLTVQPARIPLPYGAGLAAHSVDSVAPMFLGQNVSVEQMLHPSELRLRLVEKRPGFKQSDFEARVFEQHSNLAGRVLARMPRVSFARIVRPDIRRKQHRVKTLENSRESPKR